MNTKKLIQSKSITILLDSFRRLGGVIKIKDNKIILDGKIIPAFVVKTFAKKIKEVDTKNQLKVVIKNI